MRSASQLPVALHVVAQLVADGEVLGLDVMTTPSESSTYACSWGEWLTFCVCVSTQRQQTLPASPCCVAPSRWC